MKKLLALIIGCFILFSQCKGNYIFVNSVIPPRFADDLLTFVKEFTIQGKKLLVIFDRKTRGQIFDVADNFKPIAKLSVEGSDEFSMNNVFYYQDGDQHLLVAYNDWLPYLYVLNLGIDIFNLGIEGNTTIYSRNLFVGHEFSLLQLADHSLVINNANGESSYGISLSWQDIEKRRCEAYHNAIFTRRELSASDRLPLLNEGIVGSTMSIQHERCSHLSKQHFNLDSIFADAKRLLLNTYLNVDERYLEGFDSYHLTPEGLVYCGHNGFVSVWREESTRE